MSTRILTFGHNIEKAVLRHQESLKKIEERRNLWVKDKKKELIDVLTLVSTTFSADWQCQNFKAAENLETVNITFNDHPVGIFEKSAAGVKSYPQSGGYLAFAQSFNGKIHVVVGYPNIEGITEQKAPDHLDTIEPTQITESKITEYVIAFLDKMSEWEGNERFSKIGY